MKNAMSFLRKSLSVNYAPNSVATEINSAIPGFEEEDFLAWVEERFGKFQKSWNKGALEELHPFETKKMFEMHNLYFAEAKEKSIPIRMAPVSVKSAKISNFYNKQEVYEIVVHISGSVRSDSEGQNREECGYYLTFEKEKYGKQLAICPYCTAPVNENETRCEYCHTNFPNAMDQWLLAKIDKV